MSKKLIITLSIIFSVLAVVLILFWTLFALSSVSVQFHSTTKNLSLSQEQIVEAGQFRYGASVLFEGKKKSIEKLQNKAIEDENFAYLRVLNIETVFPNKFVIHVAEREELFAVQHSGQVLLCDRDFRVLKILKNAEAENFESTQDNAILLKGLQVENEKIFVGDFLTIKQKAMLKFHSLLLQNNRDLSQQLGKFKQLELSTCKDEINNEYVSLEMTTYQNRKFVINNIDFAFSNKLQLLFAAESALFNQQIDQNGNLLNSQGKLIYVAKNEKGEYVSSNETEGEPLTYELLSNCKIKVDNLTLTEFIPRTEKDIYYCFVEN